MKTRVSSQKGWNGRGTAENPRNRFERIHLVREESGDGRTATHYLKDASRSIIARNDSPDIGFDFSINPYRGCEHGCIYCYARPTHEYLGYSSGLDFETRILVKERAPELLRSELLSPRWRPKVLALSGVTDPYQPVEKRLRLTRACLEVLVEFLNPVSLVTKNHLVTRDIGLLKTLAEVNALAVSLSITSLDERLRRVLEPRTSSPSRRLKAVEALAKHGIPVTVLIAPVIPGLTEHEIPEILKEAHSAGAVSARYQLLRLPRSVKGLFADWLERYVPERKKRVLARIRDTRGGDLNDSRFYRRMSGEGNYATQIKALFENSAKRFGLQKATETLSTAAFKRDLPTDQLTLFQEQTRNDPE